MSCVYLIFLIGIHCCHSATVSIDSDGNQSPPHTASDTSSTAIKRPHSQYNALWITPIEVFNVSTAEDHVIDPAINGIMASYGEHMYSRFVEGIRDQSILVSGLDAKATVNDKFYAFQKYMHEQDRLHRSDAVPKQHFAALLAQIRSAVGAYLRRCGMTAEIIEQSVNRVIVANYTEQKTEIKNNDNAIDAKNRMFLWTAILANGSYHAPHAHEDALVSGVYFAKIPTKALDADEGVGGNLVFQDPRGAAAPFGLHFIHEPIEGQIVLFPGFLSHWVEPVKSTENRVAFSFNVPGDWNDISDVSIFKKQ